MNFRLFSLGLILCCFLSALFCSDVVKPDLSGFDYMLYQDSTGSTALPDPLIITAPDTVQFAVTVNMPEHVSSVSVRLSGSTPAILAFPDLLNVAEGKEIL
jgi:hypothetical protein